MNCLTVRVFLAVLLTAALTACASNGNDLPATDTGADHDSSSRPPDSSIDAVNDTRADQGTDGEVNDATNAADVSDATDLGVRDTAATCCPLDPPSCDCVRTGGTMPLSGECPRACDARPTGWVKGVDTNGCEYWMTSSASCSGG